MAANQLTVYDLHRYMHAKRTQHQREALTKIMDMCYSRIRRAASMRRHELTFPVPEILFGMPRYDCDMCLEALARNLAGNGFKVFRTHTRTLSISWDLGHPRETREPPTSLTTTTMTTREVSQPRHPLSIAVAAANASATPIIRQQRVDDAASRVPPSASTLPAAPTAEFHRSITCFKPSGKFVLTV